MNITRITASAPTTKDTDLTNNSRRSDKNSKQLTINNEAQDQVEIGKSPEKLTTYEKPLRNVTKNELDADDIKRLEESANQAYASLREIVRSMLLNQGKSVKEENDQPHNSHISLKIEINIEIKVNASEEAENDEDYWGVEATAARIVDFAKTTTGNDPTKIDLMREAFKDGFGQAEEASGGTLPQISMDTYDEVMRLFDEWEASEVE